VILGAALALPSYISYAAFHSFTKHRFLCNLTGPTAVWCQGLSIAQSVPCLVPRPLGRTLFRSRIPFRSSTQVSLGGLNSVARSGSETIRSRLWQERIIGSSSTMRARADQDHASQSPRHETDRRSFWRQTLWTWRTQGDKAYFAEHETASSPQGNPPRNPIESLNSLLGHLSVLEMYADLHGMGRLAEYKSQPTPTLSDGDHDLIQLQLHIWSSSFNGRLSIWHASQILRHFTEPDEFSVALGDGSIIEPVAKQA
jgi:hypothetical protein